MEKTPAPIPITAPFMGGSAPPGATNGHRPAAGTAPPGSAPPGGPEGLLVDLWDEERLADYLGVGLRFVRRLCEEGRIRYILIARHRRFDPADVIRYIEAEKRDMDDTKLKPAAPRRRGRPIGSGRAVASAGR